MQRRDFLAAAVVAGTAAATTHAIEPIRRPGRPHMRLGLAAYSFRRELDLKQANPAMNLDSFIDLAAMLPLDAVELTSYYFPETSARYLARLKGRATRLGLDISGTAVRNDFCTTNASRIKQDIAHVKSWIEHTSRLGGKTMRIFAGTVERGDTEERARQRCVEAIQECCEHAAQFGVFLALENHGGITATPELMLPIVRAVKSEWFGVNFDSGNFHSQDPYAELERIAPYSVVAQIKTEMQRGRMPKEDADLRRLVRMLRDVNYRGYVVLEHEANEDPKIAVPRHLRTLRELIA